MMAIYFGIFAYLRYLSMSKTAIAPYKAARQGKEGQARRREQKLLLQVSTHGCTLRGVLLKRLHVQSFLICASLELENLASANMKYIPATGQWVFVVYFLQNWLKLLNESMTAIILFAFNAEIRSRLLRTLRLSDDTSTIHVTVASTTPVAGIAHNFTKVSKSKH